MSEYEKIDLDSEIEQADQINDPDFDPTAAEAEEKAQAEKAAAEAEEKALANQAAAFTVINGFEMAIKAFGHKQFALAPEVKEEALERYAPLIAKYGASGLALFEKYGIEIQAGIFTATLLTSSVSQVKQLKKADGIETKKDAKKADKQADKKTNQQSSDQPSQTDQTDRARAPSLNEIGYYEPAN